jgi:hypothetical protein
VSAGQEGSQLIHGDTVLKKLLIASSLVFAGALTGCSSLNVSSNAMPVTAPLETNVKADIEVGEKISGKASVTKILFFTIANDKQFADGVAYGAGGSSVSALPFENPVSKAKSAAAYKAINESGADIIIAPRYTVETEDFLVFGTINVTVEGYKGTIKSIK